MAVAKTAAAVAGKVAVDDKGAAVVLVRDAAAMVAPGIDGECKPVLVELVTYGVVCQCGHGQKGHNETVTDEKGKPNVKAEHDLARQWDGKTTVTIPKGQEPTCPNCKGDHDHTDRG